VSAVGAEAVSAAAVAALAVGVAVVLAVVLAAAIAAENTHTHSLFTSNWKGGIFLCISLKNKQ